MTASRPGPTPGGTGQRRAVAGVATGICLAVAASLSPLVAPTPAAAQRYLKPVPTAPGVRIDSRLLADRAAARALGIPLAEDMPSLTHAGPHVKGARAVLVVLGRFSDTGEPLVTSEQVRERMFIGAEGGSTLADFYEDQSGGAFTVTGDVTGWLQTDVTLLGAAGSLNGHGWVGEDVDQHVVALLSQLDPELDFGAFDNDGPDGVANSGDDDGRVDFLSIKYTEVSGHCGGPGPWPHFGGLSVDGGPFVSDDAAEGGGTIEIPAYIMDSVIECDGTTPQGIAVTAHELGHAIGLPDYYRNPNGPEAENRHWTAGCFDLMAAGGWGCGGGALPTNGFGPTGFSAFSRWIVGWAELQEVTVADDETFVLEPLSASAHALRVRLAPESLESWIIEYRTQEGFDAALPDEGVLIYHRDEFSGPRAVNPDLPPPYSYHLVEADGDNALRLVAAEGGNRGVATDYFARTDPSGPLGPESVPSTRDHLGGHSTLTIHEITRPGPTASVRLSVGMGLHVASRSIPGTPRVLEPYVGAVVLTGGSPPYAITGQLGGLPEDLAIVLNGEALTVSGTPRAAGRFSVSVWVEDDAGTTVAESISLRVLDDPTLDGSVVLGGVVGAPGVSAEQVDYLDRSGNADGGLDLGDLRAFVNRQN
jgi:M6 family metalloprotease-like protein